jgi:carbonic anhydrase
MSEQKKVLFVIGMEYKIEQIIKENTNLNPENIFILKSYRPVISPFGDLMRDILIAVYQENVEEIVVAAAKDDQKTGINNKKIYENKDLQEKIRTFDYLFQNCQPEFPEGSIKEWLEGSKTSTESVQNSVNILRQHPLMPSNVKVRELFIGNETEKPLELAIF